MEMLIINKVIPKLVKASAGREDTYINKGDDFNLRANFITYMSLRRFYPFSIYSHHYNWVRFYA
jgi:hypothetical protein